jgi:hypothetical protein
MNAYIEGKGHFAVICAINHSISRVISRNINLYIVGRDHFAVMCAVNHPVARVI